MNWGKLILRWTLLVAFCCVAAFGISLAIARFRSEAPPEWNEWVAMTRHQPQSAASRDKFEPITAVDPFPPITEFPLAAANEATDKVDDSELVLGVVVNGDARAYPINMLTGPSREILNDELGGRAIAATW